MAADVDSSLEVLQGCVGAATQAEDGDAAVKICPITGWAVERRPEWRRLAFEQGFSLSAEIIGGCILLTHNQGRATLAGIGKAFDFTESLIEDHLSGRPFIHILDYTQLGGTTLEGRRYFIKRMLQRPGLSGVVFYGLSPMLRMSAKLGKRLRMIPFDVHIAQGYGEAVQLAQTLLKGAAANPPDDVMPARTSIADYRTREGVRHTILRRDAWQLELEGFRVRMEVIDGHILHAVAEGRLRVVHLSELIRLRECVYGSLASLQDPLFIVANLEGLQRVERRARQCYLDSMTAWHRKIPLKGYIAYGLNQFMAALTNFSRYMLPFPVSVARDLDNALAMVQQTLRMDEKGRQRGGRAASGPSSRLAEASDPVEHLLEFIGSIDWERDGLGLSRDLDDASHLRPVYDAISVIKSELDDLLNEKVAAEKALKEARDEQDSRVRTRTAELIATNRRLQKEISERREIETALRASEKNYRDLVHSVNSIILRWDAQGRIVFMNPYGLTFFGYTATDLVGRNVVGTIVPEDESVSRRDLKALMQAIRKDPDCFRNNENENMTHDGRRVWIYWTNRAITDDEGRIVEILSVGNDITGRRHMEAELRRLATTDALTGAFNRRRFFQKARQEFLRHQRYGHPLAILLMDMDHFKEINDTHGHPAGDAVLKTFVQTCHNVFRVTDIFGRTGGEEFSAVLLETGSADAFKVAERLRDRVMNSRVTAESEPVRFTVSIGVTGLRDDDMALESMIRRADKALYAAKRAGRNRVVLQENDPPERTGDSDEGPPQPA